MSSGRRRRSSTIVGLEGKIRRIPSFAGTPCAGNGWERGQEKPSSPRIGRLPRTHIFTASAARVAYPSTQTRSLGPSYDITSFRAGVVAVNHLRCRGLRREGLMATGI